MVWYTKDENGKIVEKTDGWELDSDEIAELDDLSYFFWRESNPDNFIPIIYQDDIN